VRRLGPDKPVILRTIHLLNAYATRLNAPEITCYLSMHSGVATSEHRCIGSEASLTSEKLLWVALVILLVGESLVWLHMPCSFGSSFFSVLQSCFLL
jgi:hypothetical protein